MTSKPPWKAMLLIGPTGSGKTPLGLRLETRGVNGVACLHFDFGENLRDVVARSQPDENVSRDDIEYLRDVLQRGALLNDRDFPIAERILRSFLTRRNATGETCIVMNGLPRHQGQARDLESLLDIGAIVHLKCSAETVLQRLLVDAGGDRRHRTDDDLDSVRCKLRIFAEQTEPLIDHYRRRAVPVICIEVTDTMTPEQMWLTLQAALELQEQFDQEQSDQEAFQ